MSGFLCRVQALAIDSKSIKFVDGFLEMRVHLFVSTRFPTSIISLELSFTPLPRINRHLYRGQTPILTVIMTFVLTLSNSGPDQSLILLESGENAKDDGNASIELDAHEAVGDGFGDELKVHRFAFDQDADCDHRVEGLRGNRCDYR